MSDIPELYGFIWIENIKKYAKALKKSLQDLSYLQRLEVSARQFASKRNYQECHNLHKKHLLSYRYTEGQSIEHQRCFWRCLFCGLSFSLDSNEDKEEHQERHKLFEAAYYSTGYNPDCSIVREKKKDAAKKKYSDLYPFEDESTKLEVSIALYKGFYDRSFEKAILCEYWSCL